MKKIILSLMLMSQGLIAAPIHDAARRGNLDEVERILNQNSSSGDLDENDVNAVDCYEGTPLHVAIRGGNEKVVEMLIRHGANVNATNNYGLTPLYIASVKDNENVVRMLLEDPLCDHTITDDNGRTPEYVARLKGHTEIADMFHNAPTVEQKLVKSKRNDVLQRLAARVANKSGITQDQLKALPYTAQRLIINIIED